MAHRKLLVKDRPEVWKLILSEHLPYELGMLERALEFVSSHQLAEHPEIGTLRNFAIESFWTHARNIDDFMRRNANRYATVYAAAADFADGFRRRVGIDRQKINQQITHLSYGRPNADDDKFAYADMLETYNEIKSMVRGFEERLTPEASDIWKPPYKFKEFSAGVLENKAHTTSDFGVQISGVAGSPGEC